MARADPHNREFGQMITLIDYIKKLEHRERAILNRQLKRHETGDGQYIRTEKGIIRHLRELERLGNELVSTEVAGSKQTARAERLHNRCEQIRRVLPLLRKREETHNLALSLDGALVQIESLIQRHL